MEAVNPNFSLSPEPTATSANPNSSLFLQNLLQPLEQRRRTLVLELISSIHAYLPSYQLPHTRVKSPRSSGRSLYASSRDDDDFGVLQQHYGAVADLSASDLSAADLSVLAKPKKLPRKLGFPLPPQPTASPTQSDCCTDVQHIGILIPLVPIGAAAVSLIAVELAVHYGSTISTFLGEVQNPNRLRHYAGCGFVMMFLEVLIPTICPIPMTMALEICIF